jgi:hypothetical protein
VLIEQELGSFLAVIEADSEIPRFLVALGKDAGIILCLRKPLFLAVLALWFDLIDDTVLYVDQIYLADLAASYRFVFKVSAAFFSPLGRSTAAPRRNCHTAHRGP